MKQQPTIVFGIIGALAVVGVIIASGSGDATADGAWQQTNIGDTPIEYSTSFDESGDAAIYFKYNNTSAEAVREVAAAMTNYTRSLVQQGGTVESEIVFTHPIPIDEYITFMRDLGLTPTANLLESQDAYRWFRMGAPPAEDGTAIDKEGLAFFLGDVTLGARDVGVVTAQGVTLDAATFNQVVNDPRVFAVPSLGAFIDGEIVARYPGVNVERKFTQPSRLYHAMKMSGIATPYPSHPARHRIDKANPSHES